jgi:hypothetical protein
VLRFPICGLRTWFEDVESGDGRRLPAVFTDRNEGDVVVAAYADDEKKWRVGRQIRAAELTELHRDGAASVHGARVGRGHSFRWAASPHGLTLRPVVAICQHSRRRGSPPAAVCV